MHQFSKVELFVLSTPEQSEELHQQLIDFEAGMFADLGLHFKVRAVAGWEPGMPRIACLQPVDSSHSPSACAATAAACSVASGQQRMRAWSCAGAWP